MKLSSSSGHVISFQLITHNLLLSPHFATPPFRLLLFHPSFSLPFTLTRPVPIPIPALISGGLVKARPTVVDAWKLAVAGRKRARLVPKGRPISNDPLQPQVAYFFYHLVLVLVLVLLIHINDNFLAHTHIHLHIYIHTPTDAHTHTHTCIHTYTCTHAHTHNHIITYAHTPPSLYPLSHNSFSGFARMRRKLTWTPYCSLTVMPCSQPR